MSNEDLIDTIYKLIALGSDRNPNENERASAAMKACQLIKDNNLGLGGTKTTKAYEQADQYNAAFAQKDFWQKIVLMNGSPKDIICMRLSRCPLCGLTNLIGNPIVWIPKTHYAFHPECWTKLKIKVTR